MGLLLATHRLGIALALHALAAPLIFTVVARHYFRLPAAREPKPTAFAFVGLVAVLDLVVVAGWIQHSLVMFGSISGSWLPFVLIFVATWVTGEVMSMQPWPKADVRRSGRAKGRTTHPRTVS